MKLRIAKDIFSFYSVRKSLPIFLILLLAAFLFFYQIDQESLWLDETFSLAAVKNHNYFNFNRPLYFLLLDIWMNFGHSEAWLRSLSVIFGLLTVWLTYLLGYRLINRTVGLIAALLITLSPLVINHSQEVRMYMLSTCLGVGGSLSLTYVLKSWRKRAISSWIVLRLLAILAVPINLLLILADSVIIFWHFREYLNKLWKGKLTIPVEKNKKIRLRWWTKRLSLLLIIAIISFILLKDIIPPLTIFLKDLQELNTAGVADIPDFIGALVKFTIWRLESPTDLFRNFYEKIILKFYALLLILLLATSLLKFTKKKLSKYQGRFYLVAWGFVPLLMLFLLAQIVPVIWRVDRYLLLSVPYIFILFSFGFMRLWRWQKFLALFIAIIYGIVISASLFNYYTKIYREDWRGMVNTINIEEQIGDTIVLFPDNHLKAFNYFYHGNAHIYTLERLPNSKMFRPIDQEYIDNMLQEFPQFPSRLWFVLSSAHNSMFDPNQIIPKALKNQFEVTEYKKFVDIELFLLKRKTNNLQP